MRDYIIIKGTMREWAPIYVDIAINDWDFLKSANSSRSLSGRYPPDAVTCLMLIVRDVKDGCVVLPDFLGFRSRTRFSNF